MALAKLVRGSGPWVEEIRGRDPLRHRRSRASPLWRPHDRSSCACGRLCPEWILQRARRWRRPRISPRSANLDSAFGGMQLFATEAWRAAPLLLTHSAQLTQPIVRLPQLWQRWARPHWPSVTCAAACVSDTARRMPAHCETMGVRLNHATSAWSHRPRGQILLLCWWQDLSTGWSRAGGPSAQPLVNSGSTPRTVLRLTFLRFCTVFGFSLFGRVGGCVFRD